MHIPFEFHEIVRWKNVELLLGTVDTLDENFQ